MTSDEHLLFLDFDGVTHPEGCSEKLHFSCLPPLVELLRSATQVSLVISSTWRQRRTINELRGFFPPDIASRIVGVTPEFATLKDIPPQLVAYQREAEINGWLRQHRSVAVDWTALDDRSWIFKPFNPRLELTNRLTGIDTTNINRLAQRWGVAHI